MCVVYLYSNSFSVAPIISAGFLPDWSLILCPYKCRRMNMQQLGKCISKSCIFWGGKVGKKRIVPLLQAGWGAASICHKNTLATF